MTAGQNLSKHAAKNENGFFNVCPPGGSPKSKCQRRAKVNPRSCVSICYSVSFQPLPSLPQLYPSFCGQEEPLISSHRQQNRDRTQIHRSDQLCVRVNVRTSVYELGLLSSKHSQLCVCSLLLWSLLTAAIFCSHAVGEDEGEIRLIFHTCTHTEQRLLSHRNTPPYCIFQIYSLDV